MPRKGENIRKRSDGRWEARYQVTNENGEKLYKSVYAETYLEAKRKRLKVLQGTTISKSYSEPALHQLANEWLSNVKYSIKESSYTRYHRNIYRYILPYFKNSNLQSIDIQSINDFKKDLSNGCEIVTKPLSAKTISDILSVLKLFLMFCEKENYICPDFSRTVAIKQEKNDHKVLNANTRENIELLLWNGHSELELGILLALYTGLRIGELCALKWNDINLDEGTISVTKTLERIADLNPNTNTKTKIIIDSAKTNSSQRLIPIPRAMLDHLKKFQRADNYYVLTSSITPTEPHCFYGKYKKLMKVNGIDDINFHALRHTFATQCVELGFDTKTLSVILGHANVTTTLKCYVHPSMKSKRSQMDMLKPETICGQKFG